MTADLPALLEDEAALFNALPVDGATRTNPSLRQYLRWNQDRYFAARDGLVDKGLVVRGPGRGGVIRRSETALPRGGHVVAVVIEGDKADTEVIEAAITNELGLYDPMRDVIERDWAPGAAAGPNSGGDHRAGWQSA